MQTRTSPTVELLGADLYCSYCSMVCHHRLDGLTFQFQKEKDAKLSPRGIDVSCMARASFSNRFQNFTKALRLIKDFTSAGTVVFGHVQYKDCEFESESLTQALWWSMSLSYHPLLCTHNILCFVRPPPSSPSTLPLHPPSPYTHIPHAHSAGVISDSVAAEVR